MRRVVAVILRVLGREPRPAVDEEKMAARRRVVDRLERQKELLRAIDAGVDAGRRD